MMCLVLLQGTRPTFEMCFDYRYSLTMSSKDCPSPVAETGPDASPGVCSQPIPAQESESAIGYVVFNYRHLN
jgi:hypothetical protein